jgi:hypothetical protein
MAITRRYQPPLAQGEASTIGLDYSHILPPGIGLASATIAQFINTNPPTATTDFTLGTPTTRGRNVWATISGGTPGTDYQIRWTAIDSVGNTWPRTTLILVADTS